MINDRYIIKRIIGKGRSEVYLCSDIDYNLNETAIKILPGNADPAELESFKEEYKLLRKFNHPNIVKAFDYGTILKTENGEEKLNQRKYFSLEYFSGQSLLYFEEIIKEEVLIKIIIQVSSALFYLHQSNYIYYDLKPENILVKIINGEPVVKLIDLGLAEKLKEKNDRKSFIKGTAEYIAPELLKKSEYSFNVDLYSLGIILYRIIYKKFPFDTDDQLSIYKAHIEKDFNIKSTGFSKTIVKVLKKLLEKDPQKRYTSTLEVLKELDIPLNKKIKNYWLPAKVFSNRKDLLNIANTYIEDKSSIEILAIKDITGSGKTVLLEEINFSYDNSILITYNQPGSGYAFLKQILKKITFNEIVYTNLSDDTKESINGFLNNSTLITADELKGIFAKLSSCSNFLLLLDDFNSYDNFTQEMIKEILPIFQVNKIKIVLTEDSDLDYAAASLHNIKEINLRPFTELEVTEMIERSYSGFFPKEDLLKAVLLYSDLLPGSIKDFINDCLQFNIICYGNKIEVKISDDTEKLIKNSQDQVYELKLHNLSRQAYQAAELISLFEIDIDEKILDYFIETDNKRTILEELRFNNILQYNEIGTNLSFTSKGLKRYIYSAIIDKKKYHIRAGSILREIQGFNRIEIAHQFELGENYNTSYDILKDEITEAEKISAYAYQRNLLQKVSSFPLFEKKLIEIKYSLAEAAFKLGDYRKTLDQINDLQNKNLPDKMITKIITLKGKCLAASGEYKEGEELLESALNNIADHLERIKLLISIAYVCFDQKKYEEAKNLCLEVLSNKNSNGEDKGKIYNLLGMIEIFLKNNLEESLKYFYKALEEYNKLNLKVQIAGSEINIGNIYNIRGEYKSAEEHWDKGLSINSSIGNLVQQANALVGYGIYFYNRCSYESAVNQYKKAYDIYLNIGDNNGLILVLNNLGETYLIICEYQEALKSLQYSKSILQKLKNYEGLIEALYTLGRLYFTIGEKEKFAITVKKIIEQEKNVNLKGKSGNYINYLRHLYAFSKENRISTLYKLGEAAEVFYELDDRFNFSQTYLLIAGDYISLNKLKETFQILNEKRLIEECRSNFLQESERLYLTAKILKENKTEEEPVIDLLDKSFNIIKDEQIVELTWKVLFEMSEYYRSRGNYRRTKEYLEYAKSVILHLSEKIEETELRKVYLNSKDRRYVLKLNG